MCGIVGYIGHKEVVPVLLDGLKNLEYRGYDSSGIALMTAKNHQIEFYKEKGKIASLENLLSKQKVSSSSIGIAHTRWATHGEPCQRNAHPHLNQEKTIAVVHNGIIENYQEIKSKLIQKGYQFISDTDTEVIVHLIDFYFKDDLIKAVERAIGDLKGAFAIGVVSCLNPSVLIAARVGSPLIIGVGKKEYFIASDVPAIIQYTRNVIYLKDGEIAVLRQEGIDIKTFDGKKASYKIDTVTYQMSAAQKQGYAHFMLKEIYEQPEVLAKMLMLRMKKNKVVLDGLGLSDRQLKSFSRIKIVACGTAYHAGLVGRYLIEHFARIPVEVDVSSEFRYRQPIVDKKTLMIAVSQSGETADTLAAVREAKNKGAKIISICNVIGSSLARESDGILYTHAGPEIGVASTKAYTAQLMMFYLLALKLADLYQAKNASFIKEKGKIFKALKMIPQHIKEVFKSVSDIENIAKKNSHFGCFLYLGRNINYPSALEGALKLKEISYIPAEGYPAGEMKHGPIALIDEYRAVVCIAVESNIYEKMISNIQEILSRKGNIIAIATQDDQEILRHASSTIYIPKTHPLLTALLSIIPLQLLAYYIAISRGCDVDQPRNLAKSVTVE